MTETAGPTALASAHERSIPQPGYRFMPTVTINNVECEFEPGEMIAQVANRCGVEIPQYCYHPGLTVVASCRICLAEIWAPNARNGNKLEPMMGGKLIPTCQTPASDGMVVRSDSPKSVSNQKSVMEYLLINHPLDCPVCDQAGECFLQDYSYKYGRGVSRFEEQKVKNPKKDLGPHVYLYSDRCIMCTRCVRFTREVSGTSELYVDGRGNKEEIDVFPGVAIDNDLSANVIDLCPVGALLDKDFLFAQRVWFLKTTPSIDGITSSGDNILIEHNEGAVYRIKPRTNMGVNKWWITDEVRFGWKHVHSDDRLTRPLRREFGTVIPSNWEQAYDDALEALHAAKTDGRRTAMVVSPMLTCEDAYLLGKLALAVDPDAILAVGPVPVEGKDKVFPPTLDADDPKAFIKRAEKAPNARGVRRVLTALRDGKAPLEFDAFLAELEGDSIGACVLTGNYPSAWATDRLIAALKGCHLVLIDTLDGKLVEEADQVLPSSTWTEKAGTFQNATDLLQSFEQAIPNVGDSRAEGQIALDLLTRVGAVEPDVQEIEQYSIIDEQPGMVPAARELHMGQTKLFNAGNVRMEMAALGGDMSAFASDVQTPKSDTAREADMQIVEL